VKTSMRTREGRLASAPGDELVAAAKSGSKVAFEALVERYARRILCVAQSVVGNKEDAEDIVQKSFQQAFANLHKFEGRSSFFTWLTRIAINEAFMCLRINRRTSTASLDELARAEGTEFALQIPDSGPSPERCCSERERKQFLSLAMARLTPEKRTAIQLCELEERTFKESAQMMGVSIATVKSRVLRGRRELSKTLKRFVAPKLNTAKRSTRNRPSGPPPAQNQPLRRLSAQGLASANGSQT
jgi:RNA polymerase sigma factor (sigma-70 family)